MIGGNEVEGDKSTKFTVNLVPVVRLALTGRVRDWFAKLGRKLSRKLRRRGRRRA